MDHGLNWYYLPVLTGALALIWVISLRALTLHSMQAHRTHYKLSDGKRYSSLTAGSSLATSEVKSSAINGVGASRPSSGGVGGLGAVAGGGSGSRDGSRERLKLDVHPGSMVTSCTQLSLRSLLKQPPVL